MKLSITIVSFNSRAISRAALRSICEQTSGLDYEIIVVDNDSSDGSAEMIRREFPTVRLVCNDSNRGFASAHNMAIQRSTGEYILILNSDTRFVGNAARAMIENMESAGTQVGFLGPRVNNEDGTVAHTTRRKVLYSKFMVAMSIVNQFFPFASLIPVGLIRSRFRRIFGRLHDAFDPPVSRRDVEWVDGACVLCRRQVLQEIGLFDEQFFFGAEIGDLLCRGRRAGWRVRYDPTVQVVHLRGRSRGSYRRAAFHSHIGMLRYYAKQFPDYVGVMKRTYRIVLPLAAGKERVLGVFSSDAQKRNDKLSVLRDIRRALPDVTIEKVRTDEVIPTLVGSPVPEAPAMEHQLAFHHTVRSIDETDPAHSAAFKMTNDVKR